MRTTRLLSVAAFFVFASLNLFAQTDVTVRKVNVPIDRTHIGRGEVLQYSITVANDGPNPANVTLSDVIPAGATFESIVQTGGVAFLCTTPAVGGTGTVSCTAANMPSATHGVFTLSVRINAGASGTISNTATASSNVADPDPSDNSSTPPALTITNPGVDLTVTKSASPPTPTAGDVITYTVVVSNLGSTGATQVLLDDAVPANTTFESAFFTAGGGTGAPFCAPPSVTPNGHIQCVINFLPPGPGFSFTIRVRVNQDAVGATITNTATVSSPAADTNPANNSATVQTNVSPVPPVTADLSVFKVLGAGDDRFVGPGETITWFLTARNDGPSNAANFTLTDALPANTNFESITQTAGPTFNCTTPAAGTNGTVTCTNASLALGAQATFTLVARVSPSAGTTGTITNTATVSSNNPDPDPSDNSSTAPPVTLTNPGADVAVSKSASPATPTAGDILAYTVVVSNIGSVTATSVILDDAVPANTTFVGASLIGGGGTGAPFCAPPFATNNGHVQCVMNTLPPNVSFSFRIQVRVNPDAVGATITNTATVSSPTADPNQANNTATVQTNVSPVPPVNADISIGKFIPNQNVPFAGPGETITYLLLVRNGGPAAAQSFTITDALPPNTTFESIVQTAGPAFTCTTPAVGANGTVTCSIASLASGANADFTLVVRVAPNAGTSGTITNTATVTSSSPDPNPANNSSSRTVTLMRPGADLQITKTSTPANATPGQPLTYNITVTNVGSRGASEVRLSDTIPAQTTFLTYTEPPPTGINCFPPVNNNAFTCAAFGIGPGDSLMFTFSVRVNDNATGPAITNTATVTAAAFTPDPDTSNNSVTIQSPLPPTTADLAVTKTTPDPLVGRGDTTTFAITLTNNGPLAAQNVTLTDAIPTGTTFQSFVQNSGPAFACTTAGTISCTNASFANGATATFTLTVRVNANAGGTITNTASATSQTPDHNNVNNSASASFTAAQPGADLDVNKTAEPATITPGSNLTYTITVTNVGTDPAASIALSDPLPANTTFVSVSDDGGAGTTCNPPISGVVQCTIDALTPGQTRTITLVVNVNANATGTISNTATVTSPSVDPDMTNNAGSAATTIGAASHANIPALDPGVLLLLALALAVAGFMAVKS